MAERANRFLKSSLTKAAESENNWHDALSLVQYVMNNTKHASLNSTPSKLLLGYDQRNHADREITALVDRLAGVDRQIESERERARNVAIEATEKIRNYNKLYYDAAHKKPSLYKEQQLVLIRDSQTRPGQSRKLKSQFKGPYMISKVLNHGRYVVTDVPGFNLSGKALNTILSADKLKPFATE
ncbi:uncharacterized protein [Cardiocondyla obscurior]|uniref:uncharacterized protein n=1 Tax=Cardiocondyla obscurior TaxID=286306 RepID=UPI00396575A5